MAFIPYTLKNDQVFTRSNSNEQDTIKSGTRVFRETTESDTHIFHRFRITQDGSYWFHTLTIPKEVNNSANPSPAVPTPSVIQSHPATSTNGNGHHNMSNTNSTNKSVNNAVSRIASREGISLKTGEAEELKVRRLERVREILSGEVWEVNYYIPVKLAKTKRNPDGIRNPSYIFRRHGYRLDGSHWVFTAKGLEHPHVKEWFAMIDRMQPVEEESGLPGFQSKRRAEYWKILYTKEQREAMRDSCVRQLSQTLIECHKSLIKRIDKAAKTVEKAVKELGTNVTANALNEIQQKQANTLRATIKDAYERFEMCLKGAEIYDDTGSLDALFEAVRDVVAARGSAINGLLAMRGMKQVKTPKVISTPGANSIHVDSKSINPMTIPPATK